MEVFGGLGWTVLDWTSLEIHFQVVETVISAGVGLDIAEFSEFTALMWAAENSHIEVAEALIRAGANLNRVTVERDNDSRTFVMGPLGSGALLSSVLLRYSALAKNLVGSGANTTIRDSDGKTARDYAESDELRILFG